MVRVYVRLPEMMVAFYRNRNEDRHYKPEEPVVFSRFSVAYHIMSYGVRVSAYHKDPTAIFSMLEWNNMMNGYKPDGSAKVMTRDKKEWLTFEEICTIMNKSVKNHTAHVDYLCIALPKMVMRDKALMPCSPACTLSDAALYDLQKDLREGFIRTLCGFIRENIDFCLQEGISRTRADMYERFMCLYDIPVSDEQTEKESLRRQMARWEKEGLTMFDPSQLRRGKVDITRIDKDKDKRYEL